MNKEAYVSFEVAKLLKEKGFDWFTYAYYTKDDVDTKPYLGMENLCPDNWNGEVDEVNDLWTSAPTQQMACRWLREVHNTHIGVFVDDVDKYVAFLDEIPATGHTSVPIEGAFATYENAIEAALQYVLTNLI